jgi:hypothetical protein
VSARAELEAAQAALKSLEERMVSDVQLQLLADQLDREAKSWEQQLDKGEKRRLRDDDSGPAGRVMAFAFALLAVTPVVSMIGISLSRMLRHEHELAWVLVVSGVLVVGLTSLPAARRALAHRVSSAWKLSRRAHDQAAVLRGLL